MLHYVDASDSDTNASELSAAIGAKVRAERQAREWTLDQLAKATGVSRRMIINVEQGSANPSVTTLLRISDALGIGLPSLVDVPQVTPVKVVRNGAGAALWSGLGGSRGVLLAGTTPPHVLELWDWTLAVGDRHDSEAHVRGTKEILQAREGTVTVVVADQVEVLEVGDAISFASDVAHSYANEGTEPVRFSLAVLEPGVGAGSTSAGSHD